MNRVPDDPPLFHELLSWCALEIDRAATDLIAAGELWISPEGGGLKAKFVSNYDVTNDDGDQDLLHKVFDIGDVCRSMVKNGHDPEALALAFDDIASALRKM